MTTNGWNLARFGRDQSRPYQTGSSSTMIACRICDNTFLSTHSLLEHYESHQGDFVNPRQNPQRTNVWDFHREGSNPFQQRAPQQRPHPYFPSGYRSPTSFHVPAQNPFLVPAQNPFLVPAQNPFLVPTQNPFLVPTQNPQVTHPRSHLVTTGLAGRDLGASASQLVINRPTETPGSLLGPPVRLEYQKGYDETADKRTKWYLGQLERPIPKIINLENRNRNHTSYRI